MFFSCLRFNLRSFSPLFFRKNEFGIFALPCLFPLVGMALILLQTAAGCSDPDSPNIPISHRKLTAAQREKAASHVLEALPDEGVTFPADVALANGAIRYLGTSLRTGENFSTLRLDHRSDSSEVSKQLENSQNSNVVLQTTEAAKALKLSESAILKVTLRRGEKVQFVHYFSRVGELDEAEVGDWKIFVHASPLQTPKKNVFNADHHPVEGLLPLKKWPKGKVIEDVHQVTIPEFSPESLSLWIGFFQLNKRMAVVGTRGQDGQNRLAAGQISVEGSVHPLPTYQIHRRRGAIVLDGKLDDEGWKGVASTGNFGRSLDGKTPHSRTEAWMTWDDEAIYVAFDMDDRDIWGTYRHRDDAIYNEEVVEVFLDANGDGKTYHELELSPHRVVFDAYFPTRRRGMDKSWDSQMESGVSIRGTLDDGSDRDHGWTVELKIPVKNLVDLPRWPPESGDKWRFNLYRLDWHSGRKKNEGQAFSPLFMGDFHHLPRFGFLEFQP